MNIGTYKYRPYRGPVYLSCSIRRAALYSQYHLLLRAVTEPVTSSTAQAPQHSTQP